MAYAAVHPKSVVLGCCPFYGGGCVVVDSLLIVTLIVGFCNCSLFCWTLLYVHSSSAIILFGKREMVALLSLSSWCFVIVVRLFLALPWVFLQFVIVVFPDHTHLLCLLTALFCACIWSTTFNLMSLFWWINVYRIHIKYQIMNKIMKKHTNKYVLKWFEKS